MTPGRRNTPNVPDPQQHQPMADLLEGSLEVLGPRPRHPPYRFVLPEVSTQAEGATAITQPARAIVQPRACSQAPQAPQATTERQD
jgi:hypothetical protein